MYTGHYHSHFHVSSMESLISLKLLPRFSCSFAVALCLFILRRHICSSQWSASSFACGCALFVHCLPIIQHKQEAIANQTKLLRKTASLLLLAFGVGQFFLLNLYLKQNTFALISNCRISVLSCANIATILQLVDFYAGNAKFLRLKIITFSQLFYKH